MNIVAPPSMAPCDILSIHGHKKGQPDGVQELAFFTEKTETA